MKKVTSREAQHSSARTDWMTPAHIISVARSVLGDIDLDPASSVEANATVKAGRIYTSDDDGLSQDWCGRVWLNPPYGRVGPKSSQSVWLAKLADEHTAGRVTQAIALFNSCTGDKWFRSLWGGPLCFIHGRVKFLLPGGQSDQPTHSSVLAYFGPNWKAFSAEAVSLGQVVVPRALADG